MCFCKEKIYDLTRSTSKEELSDILKDWGFNIKCKNGEDYKESVTKIMWNSNPNWQNSGSKGWYKNLPVNVGERI